MGRLEKSSLGRKVELMPSLRSRNEGAVVVGSCRAQVGEARAAGKPGEAAQHPRLGQCAKSGQHAPAGAVAAAETAAAVAAASVAAAATAAEGGQKQQQVSGCVGMCGD